MTISEFSDQFDILLSSYSTQTSYVNGSTDGGITLDEYEKSVFLTQAQEDLVLGLYTGRASSLQSFEESEELRRYLSPLIKEAFLTPSEKGGFKGIDTESKFFELPEKLWFITYECVKIEKGKCVGHTYQEVVPVTQDEYHKIRKNPFRGMNYRRALRLDLGNNHVEVVSLYPIAEYYVRYLRRPRPILLTDLPDTLSIDGERDISEGCELHEGLHQQILEKAVQLAMSSRAGMPSQQSKETSR